MKTKAKQLLALAALAAPALALAHPGSLADHAHAGFAAGFAHPFTGLDHLAAMLAVGVWSALAVRPVWVAPMAFVVMLAAGALAGFGGLAVPMVEPMIAASLLVIGLLVVTRARLPLWAAAAAAGGFAFFHGAAHGLELAGDRSMAALAGMLLATALLHLAGIALGRLVLQRQRWASGAAGGAVALLGAGLLLRLV